MIQTQNKFIISGEISAVILKISLPLAFNNLVFSIYGLIDIFFLSHLGSNILSALLFVHPIEAVFVAIQEGLGVGGSSLLANRIGQKQQTACLSAQLLYTSVGLGTLLGLGIFMFPESILRLTSAPLEMYPAAMLHLRFTALVLPIVFFNGAYVAINRAEGKTVIVGAVNSASVILKTIALFLFLTIFRLGIYGVLLSSLIGYLTVFLYGLYDFVFKRNDNILKPAALLPRGKTDNIRNILMILKIGVPAMAEKSSLSYGNILINRYALDFGSAVLGAFGITNRINSLIFSFFSGFGGGLSVALAQNYGANRFDRMKQMVRQSCLISALIAVVPILFVIIWRRPLSMFFGADDELLVRHTMNAISVYSISAVPWAIMQMIIGYFQGVGKTHFNLIISVFRIYGARVPIILLLTRLSSIGAYSIWYGMLLSNIVTMLFALILYWYANGNILANQQALSIHKERGDSIMAMNKSTVKTVAILEMIAESNGITLSEIAHAMNMPMASTSDILKALLSHQMIEIADLRSKTYKIGVKLFWLGNSYLANADILKVATPFLEKLSEQTKKTAFLAKLVDRKITYIYKCEPKDSLISTCQIGSRAGLSTSALGKVILAFNEQEMEKALASPLPQKTRFSISDPVQLKEELAKVREMKYAVDRFECDERIFCVGFPIFDRNGNVEYSISISGAYEESRDVEREIELGKKCMEEISARLGYAQ